MTQAQLKPFTLTVHCFDDKTLRKNFRRKKDAINYANDLLAQGHKVKIFPYRKFTYDDQYR